MKKITMIVLGMALVGCSTVNYSAKRGEISVVALTSSGCVNELERRAEMIDMGIKLKELKKTFTQRYKCVGTTHPLVNN